PPRRATSPLFRPGRPIGRSGRRADYLIRLSRTTRTEVSSFPGPVRRRGTRSALKIHAEDPPPRSELAGREFFSETCGDADVSAAAMFRSRRPGGRAGGGGRLGLTG